MNDPLDFLLHRQSVPMRQLQAPGPDTQTLLRLCDAAIRVPDHGKLTPWRLLTVEGEAKLEMGRRLAQLALENYPDLPPTKLEKERKRYTFAPLIIIVVARIDPENRIPAQEQLLSAGCVAYNLLLGAQALGFGADWRTGWAAHDRKAAQILGLADNERVVGFMHVGTPRRELPERRRASADGFVSAWTP